MSTDRLVGVMLMAFGGPDSLDCVEPFMGRLMRGRKPTPEIIKRAKDKYCLIGGKSPLTEITQKQAQALEEKLNTMCGHAATFRTYVGMQYWHPFIEETIEKMVADGIREVYAISMSPHSSTVSTKAYADEINRVIRERGFDISITMVQGLYDNPLFIDAVVEKINSALAQFGEIDQGTAKIIFSAHSLPMAYIEAGDPYVEEIKRTVTLVVAKIANIDWRLAYQSKGAAPGEWLSPPIEDVFDEFVEQGISHVLIVPIGFAADHMETLWDIDILHRGQAEELGLCFVRSGALNDSPRFIEALAAMVCDEMNAR